MNENDYELLYMARSHDEWAIETLLNKFRPFVLKTYGQLQPKRYSFELDEALQAANLGLMSAIYYYRDDLQTSFHSFAMICMERQILNSYRKVKLMSSVDYCTANSLDRRVNDEDEMYLADVIADESQVTAEEAVRLKVSLENIYEQIQDSQRDVDVLRLRLQGYSYLEVAQRLQITKKDVDNSLQRIKKKIGYSFD